MKASRDNKVYTIDEAQKESYKAQGFDITDEDGKVIAYGAGKTVSYDKHKELEDNHKELIIAYGIREDKCIALEKENEELKLSAMTIEQLKAYAADRKVDLGDATTKEAILLKFKEVK